MNLEPVLDSLLHFKAVNIEAVSNIPEAGARITRKIKMVFKAYDKEIAAGLSSVVLPARYAKYIFFVIAAFQLLQEKQRNSKMA